jgi:hypothetical protein
MPFTVITQPQSQSAVPGQDTTFTVQASSNDVPALSARYTYQWSTIVGSVTSTIPDATSTSYVFDPLLGNNGNRFVAVATFLSGAGGNPSTFVSRVTSNQAILTVAEDGTYPFNLFDLGSETGQERHRRLRHLGYV